MSTFPDFHDILSAPAVKTWSQHLHPAVVFTTVKNVFDEIRAEAVHAATEKRLPDFIELTHRIAERLAEQMTHPSGGGVTFLPQVDASGVIFSDRRLTPELSDAAAEILMSMVIHGIPLQKNSVVETFATVTEENLRTITGAEDVLFFSSVSTAILAVLATFASQKSVVMSRGEMFQWQNGTRWTDLLRCTSSTLCEVGSVNLTTLDDYTAVESPGLVIVASGVGTSCRFAMPAENISTLCHRLSTGAAPYVPVLLAAEVSPLVSLETILPNDTATNKNNQNAQNLRSILSVKEMVSLGADMVLCPTSQLIGGPHGAILLGKKRRIDTIRKLSFCKELAMSPEVLVALHATLEGYSTIENASVTIPIVKTLGLSVESLRSRASRMIPLLAALPFVEQVESVDSVTFLFTECPHLTVPTVKLQLTPHGISAGEIAMQLLQHSPEICAGFTASVLSFDLRTFHPKWDMVIVEALENGITL